MAPQTSRRRQGYLPLESYAALGDGRSIALSGADGSIDWWCVPRLDGERVLDRLLDAADGGRFEVRPVGPFSVDRGYLPDSNVLATEVTTPGGRARLVEGMAMEPGGARGPSQILRRVVGLEGTVRFRVAFRPGRSSSVSCELRASPEIPLRRRRDDLLEGRFLLADGQEQAFSLAVASEAPAGPPPGRRLDQADAAWRGWARGLTIEGPHAALVRRHALALKLLCAPGGAIPAAGTTSLPEIMGGERNWDFRYVWVRDAAYTIEALVQVGAVEDSARAFAWLIERIAEHGPRVVFDLDGAVAPTDEELDVPGYRNSRPAHVGNLATGQRQHGVFGDMLQAAVRLVDAGRPLDAGAARVLGALADECARCWDRPDAGLWELSEMRRYANSRLSCWQALACAVDLADRGILAEPGRAAWTVERDRIAAWIEQRCWSEARQAYVAWPGSEAIDASLALVVRLGFGARPRQEATIRAIDEALRSGLFHHRLSGVQDSEGCFLACSFWIIEAKARLGRREEAAADFEALVVALGGVGVLPEMAEAGTGRWLGNMPQGLTHLALIQAAAALTQG
ncbi:glycoside hydrolase family 15 protein [Brevundimonas sp.]|uniref:glycoside hydrolase family 15 protein n=1 Tax=Brevundimonas sp. TaxID=1871086 RepID=UPI002D3215E9|nr:glycoside hydrolase family 15 protein [Brevundimonas sp.]HYC96821.1 glycoside hydrolase family 15 protein [Brevundimonas sp.]